MKKYNMNAEANIRINYGQVISLQINQGMNNLSRDSAHQMWLTQTMHAQYALAVIDVAADNGVDRNRFLAQANIELPDDPQQSLGLKCRWPAGSAAWTFCWANRHPPDWHSIFLHLKNLTASTASTAKFVTTAVAAGSGATSGRTAAAGKSPPVDPGDCGNTGLFQPGQFCAGVSPVDRKKSQPVPALGRGKNQGCVFLQKEIGQKKLRWRTWRRMQRGCRPGGISLRSPADDTQAHQSTEVIGGHHQQNAHQPGAGIRLKIRALPPV